MKYLVHTRDGVIKHVIPIDENGTLLDNNLQPPPWWWRLKPGDKVTIAEL